VAAEMRIRTSAYKPESQNGVGMLLLFRPDRFTRSNPIEMS